MEADLFCLRNNTLPLPHSSARCHHQHEDLSRMFCRPIALTYVHTLCLPRRFSCLSHTQLRHHAPRDYSGASVLTNVAGTTCRGCTRRAGQAACPTAAAKGYVGCGSSCGSTCGSSCGSICGCSARGSVRCCSSLSSAKRRGAQSSAGCECGIPDIANRCSGRIAKAAACAQEIATSTCRTPRAAATTTTTTRRCD